MESVGSTFDTSVNTRQLSMLVTVSRPVPFPGEGPSAAAEHGGAKGRPRPLVGHATCATRLPPPTRTCAVQSDFVGLQPCPILPTRLIPGRTPPPAPSPPKAHISLPQAATAARTPAPLHACPAPLHPRPCPQLPSPAPLCAVPRHQCGQGVGDKPPRHLFPERLRGHAKLAATASPAAATWAL